MKLPCVFFVSMYNIVGFTAANGEGYDYANPPASVSANSHSPDVSTKVLHRRKYPTYYHGSFSHQSLYGYLPTYAETAGYDVPYRDQPSGDNTVATSGSEPSLTGFRGGATITDKRSLPKETNDVPPAPSLYLRTTVDRARKFPVDVRPPVELTFVYSKSPHTKYIGISDTEVFGVDPPRKDTQRIVTVYGDLVLKTFGAFGKSTA